MLKKYESTQGKGRWFCSVCGSPIYSSKQALPGIIRIRVGSIITKITSRVNYHFYTDSAAEWVTIPDDGLPRHPGAVPK